MNDIKYVTYSVLCKKCDKIYSHKVKTGLTNKEVYEKLSINRCKCQEFACSSNGQDNDKLPNEGTV